MPTFEYVCRDCSEQYDMFFKVREEKDAVACPACGSKNSTKKFSAFATAGSSSDSFADFGGCADGSCGIPASPCASGMCGLN